MSKQTYRVKPGHRFGLGKALGPGDTVQLTEAEAQGFLDKLELVPEVKRGELVVNPTGDPKAAEDEAGDTDDSTEKTEEPKPAKGKKA